MTAAFLDGPDEIRTHDPYNANVVRSQLRYKPMHLQQNQSSTKCLKMEEKIKKTEKKLLLFRFSCYTVIIQKA